MSEESLRISGPEHASYAGRLPLFDQIAQGFLKTLASSLANGEVSLCMDYLDDQVKSDGAVFTRRLVVLAIEDMRQQIEAPLPLRVDAYALMELLKLDPIPELTLYRDLATVILRIDAALHLSRLGQFSGRHIYH